MWWVMSLEHVKVESIVGSSRRMKLHSQCVIELPHLTCCPKPSNNFLLGIHPVAEGQHLPIEILPNGHPALSLLVRDLEAVSDFNLGPNPRRSVRENMWDGSRETKEGADDAGGVGGATGVGVEDAK